MRSPVFYIVHYVLSFDDKSSNLVSPIRFGVGFNGQSHPAAGDIVPKLVWEADKLLFGFDVSSVTSAAAKVILHPSTTGEILVLQKQSSLTFGEVEVLYPHIFAPQVDIHCQTSAETVRKRDAAHIYLKALLQKRIELNAKAGVTYVLPLKPDQHNDHRKK